MVGAWHDVGSGTKGTINMAGFYGADTEQLRGFGDLLAPISRPSLDELVESLFEKRDE